MTGGAEFFGVTKLFEMIEQLGANSVDFDELVADTPRRQNQARMLGVALDLAAQPAHDRVHGPFRHRGLAVPDLRQERRALNTMPGRAASRYSRSNSCLVRSTDSPRTSACRFSASSVTSRDRSTRVGVGSADSVKRALRLRIAPPRAIQLVSRTASSGSRPRRSRTEDFVGLGVARRHHQNAAPCPP